MFGPGANSDWLREAECTVRDGRVVHSSLRDRKADKADKAAKVGSIFHALDADQDGYLNKDEYRSYLVCIGSWGVTKGYNETDWDAEWPEQAPKLGGTAERGVNEAGITILYTKYRAAHLDADCVKVPAAAAKLEAAKAAKLEAEKAAKFEAEKAAKLVEVERRHWVTIILPLSCAGILGFVGSVYAAILQFEQECVSSSTQIAIVLDALPQAGCDQVLLHWPTAGHKMPAGAIGPFPPNTGSLSRKVLHRRPRPLTTSCAAPSADGRAEPRLVRVGFGRC